MGVRTLKIHRNMGVMENPVFDIICKKSECCFMPFDAIFNTISVIAEV